MLGGEQVVIALEGEGCQIEMQILTFCNSFGGKAITATTKTGGGERMKIRLSVLVFPFLVTAISHFISLCDIKRSFMKNTGDLESLVPHSPAIDIAVCLAWHGYYCTLLLICVQHYYRPYR